MFKVRVDRRGIDNLALRFEAMKRTLLNSLATLLLERLHTTIPKSPKWLGRYRKALTVRGITGNLMAIAVMAEATARPGELNDTEAILYVEGPTNARWQSVADVLQRGSPWALTTLPRIRTGIPIRGYIQIVTRAEAQKVAARNSPLIKSVEVAYNEVGLEAATGAPVKFTGRVRLDLGMMVARAELGMGPIRLRHWRPALLWLASRGMRQIIKEPQFLKILTSAKAGKLIAAATRPFANAVSVTKAQNLRKFLRLIQGQSRNVLNAKSTWAKDTRKGGKHTDDRRGGKWSDTKE